eukprot:1155799-Pelagomonas_calceolata.AAC.2
MSLTGSMHWDGGDDCTNTPLENIMLVNHKGPIFHSAVPGDGELVAWHSVLAGLLLIYMQALMLSTNACARARTHTHTHTVNSKTSLHLCNMLGDVLDDFGPKKIVLLASDSASNCKGAAKLLQERYPHLSCALCDACPG